MNQNWRWKDVVFVGGFSLRPGRPTYMRRVVVCVGMLDLPFLVVSVGCCLPAILEGLFGEATNNTAWVVRLQTSLVVLVALFLCICRLGGCTSGFARAFAQMLQVICFGRGPCGFEVRMPLGASKRDRATATHKKYVHHKNCRGGGDAQITCPRCNKIFSSVRARAAHEPSCRCCRWCDLRFRTGGNRLLHEATCPGRPQAEHVDG